MSFDPNLLPTLLKDESLIEDLCRYADAILSEKQVRARWDIADDEIWHAMGSDESFVKRVELERVRRIRDGRTTKELSQTFVAKAPAVLEKILTDERASPRHRINAAETLHDFAGFTPETATDQTQFFITIDLGGGEKITYGGSRRPIPPNDVKTIDAPPQQEQPAMIETVDQQDPPVRRSRGRPRGSRNRPKRPEPPMLEDSESWKT
jgi:hypothetical protein